MASKDWDQWDVRRKVVPKSGGVWGFHFNGPAGFGVDILANDRWTDDSLFRKVDGGLTIASYPVAG